MVVPVNVGPGTAPETFMLARNAWYCLDAAGPEPAEAADRRRTGASTARTPGSGTPSGATCGSGRAAPWAEPGSGRMVVESEEGGP